MVEVCPAIMPKTDDPDDFREMMVRLGSIAPRLQVDLMDGEFAPNRNTSPDEVWWTEGKIVDIHLMYLYPEEAVRVLLTKHPHMIILHAESQGDLQGLMNEIKEAGVSTGIAMLRTTPVEDAHELIEMADHVLLFGGELGNNGVAELSSLDKIPSIRQIHPGVEVGWDGGANESNMALICGAGVDIVNVGGALRDAEDPQYTYERLLTLSC